ncbi:BnaA01g18230D [Brassica napus]|uniref:BnaA01g18230D protein n=1 Tax=Brassica napus TaxID=3708 RepID=A0A078G8X5_BRANA|nr:BnaA01g18230D [Brassica napus]
MANNHQLLQTFNGGGEWWHTAEDFCRRDKKTEEERRLRDIDTWRKIQGEDDWAGLTDPMDPVLRSELIRYGEMAQACYDAFDFNPSSRYCGNPCRVLASKCITSPFRSDVGCWFDEALRTQAVLLEAGFLNIFGIVSSRAVSVWTG